MAKILLTGGAGYIGAHVNKALYSAGYETVVIDNLSRGHQEFVKWGVFYKGNIGNRELLEKIFGEHNIQTVIHLAGYAYVEESVREPIKYWKNNFSESLELLDVARKFNLSNFIFSSSCATYGGLSVETITENKIQCPINTYGKTKLAIEFLLKDIAKTSNMAYGILRYFNAAGADIDCEIGERHTPETHLIPLILQSCFDAKNEISIYGIDYDTKDGTCIRDYIHVSDLAEAHVRTLKYLEECREDLECNLGLGKGFSVRDVLDSSRRVTGHSARERVEGRRVGDPPSLVADPTKAKEILNWHPAFNDLDSIIETAWHWHKKEWHD